MRWLDQRCALYGWPPTTSGSPSSGVLSRASGLLAPLHGDLHRRFGMDRCMFESNSPWERLGWAGPRCGMPLSASPRAPPLQRSWTCSGGQRGRCIDWIDASTALPYAVLRRA
jgi:hypothetical protein